MLLLELMCSELIMTVFVVAERGGGGGGGIKQVLNDIIIDLDFPNLKIDCQTGLFTERRNND